MGSGVFQVDSQRRNCAGDNEQLDQRRVAGVERVAASGRAETCELGGHLVFLQPVSVDGTTNHVIELIHAGDVPSSVRRGIRELLSVIGEITEDFDRNWQRRQLQDREQLREQFDEFIHQIHGRLDAEHVAYAIANEGQRIIECDRLTVLRIASGSQVDGR